MNIFGFHIHAVDFKKLYEEVDAEADELSDHNGYLSSFVLDLKKEIRDTAAYIDKLEAKLKELGQEEFITETKPASAPPVTLNDPEVVRVSNTYVLPYGGSGGSATNAIWSTTTVYEPTPAPKHDDGYNMLTGVLLGMALSGDRSEAKASTPEPTPEHSAPSVDTAPSSDYTPSAPSSDSFSSSDFGSSSSDSFSSSSSDFSSGNSF